MPINPYFYTSPTGPSSEQEVIDDIHQEFIQNSGQEVYYLPRTVVDRDEIYGEDRLSRFELAIPLEAYVETFESFGGEGDMLSRFGLEVRDSIDLTVSRTRFREVTSLPRPREGDIIYFPLSGHLFEIAFVETEDRFYPANMLFTWRLRLNTFEYSHEQFNTGVDDIDSKIEKLLQPAIDDVDSNADVVVEPDLGADNEQIEREAREVLEFNETNPFGTY